VTSENGIAAPHAYQPGIQLLLALPSYATHPVENIRELCSNYFRQPVSSASSTEAVRDSAVQFTRLVASGMIGDQRLEHSGELRGKSFGPDALGGNASALA
jgi:hypothetical protein